MVPEIKRAGQLHSDKFENYEIKRQIKNLLQLSHIAKGVKLVTVVTLLLKISRASLRTEAES